MHTLYILRRFCKYDFGKLQGNLCQTVSSWKETQCMVQAPSLLLLPLVVMGLLCWRTKHIVCPEIPIQVQAPSLPLPSLVEIDNRKTTESMNQSIFDLDNLICYTLLYLLSSCFVLLCGYTSSQLVAIDCTQFCAMHILI